MPMPIQMRTACFFTPFFWQPLPARPNDRVRHIDVVQTCADIAVLQSQFKEALNQLRKSALPIGPFASTGDSGFLLDIRPLSSFLSFLPSSSLSVVFACTLPLSPLPVRVSLCVSSKGLHCMTLNEFSPSLTDCRCLSYPLRIVLHYRDSPINSYGDDISLCLSLSLSPGDAALGVRGQSFIHPRILHTYILLHTFCFTPLCRANQTASQLVWRWLMSVHIKVSRRERKPEDHSVHLLTRDQLTTETRRVCESRCHVEHVLFPLCQLKDLSQTVKVLLLVHNQVTSGTRKGGLTCSFDIETFPVAHFKDVGAYWCLDGLLLPSFFDKVKCYFLCRLVPLPNVERRS
mmetsp:Transcript_26441/g.51932  ORF Transcript_26441/g.51932 Transcript_26441/m.51932 type:complete len:346 (-) Transcript_26441:235-1272(-)